MNYRFKQNIYELSKTEYVQEDWYYKVYTDYGSHSFLRRNEAYDYYSSNKGYRIELIDKGTRDVLKVVVDEKGLDTEKIREDFSIKKTNKSTRQAISKYDRTNTRQICIKLNLNTDADIIFYLNAIDNKNGKIKELIRDDISKYSYMPIYNKTNEIRTLA